MGIGTFDFLGTRRGCFACVGTVLFIVRLGWVFGASGVVMFEVFWVGSGCRELVVVLGFVGCLGVLWFGWCVWVVVWVVVCGLWVVVWVLCAWVYL